MMQNRCKKKQPNHPLYSSHCDEASISTT